MIKLNASAIASAVIVAMLVGAVGWLFDTVISNGSRLDVLEYWMRWHGMLNP